MRQQSGYTFEENGKWYARITYTGENGQRRNVKRRAESKSHANAILRKLIRELEDNGTNYLDVSRLTMRDLINFYRKHYLKPAEYVFGRKVTGLRSSKVVAGYLSIIEECLGKKLLREITYSDIRTFRNLRLQTPTWRGKQRAIATVNREMAYLRRLLNIAQRESWILRNPFTSGDSLINISDEQKRERILTREEEERLLNACIGKRAHLRAIIICALDSGMRRGEIIKLRWRDVDFENHIITIAAFNSKTMRERIVSMTTRLMIELKRLTENSSTNSEELVFGIKDTFKNAYMSACRVAGLTGVRFHDLRHTHATRLDDLGFSLAKIAGQLGHTQLQTTLRYVNRDKLAVKQVASALDLFNSRPQAQQVSVEEVTEMVN